ncbi:cleavage stimulation factor 77 [Vairimorpha necatrix]|uniref:Cleavage stimulation factor 77 n=1 Tax=Vairimorpha necatrix TaxID=6039 RepID=A0AAX4JGU9_9MICR
MFINKDTIHDHDLDDHIIQEVYDIKIIQSYLQSSMDLFLLEKILIKIGYSQNSAPLYKKYLKMLNNLSDENTKIERMRNTFIHILQVPMHSLPELYADYEEFELEYNKPQAKKILQETFLMYQNTLSFYHHIKKAKDMKIELENPLKLHEDMFHKRICFLYKESIYFNYKDEETYFNFSEYLIKNNKYEEAREIVRLGIENTTGIFLKIYHQYRIINNKELTNNKLTNNELINLELVDQDYIELSKYDMVNLKRKNDREDIPDFLSILIMNHLSLILKRQGLIPFRKEFINLKIKGLVNDVIYKNIADYEYKYTSNKDIVTKIYTSGIEETDSKYLKQELVNFLLKTGDYNNALMYVKKYEVGDEEILKYEFKYGEDFFNLLNTKKTEKEEDKKIKEDKEAVSPYEISKKIFSFGMRIELREDVKEFIKKINYVKKGDDILRHCDLDELIIILSKI